MSIWPTVRQWLFPREFRIAPVTVTDDLLSAIERLESAVSTIREVADPGPAGAAGVPEAGATVGPPKAALADLATGLWRLRERMVEPGTNRPREDMRRAFRHLESSLDALVEAGVQVLDHTGEPFHYGTAITVIAYESKPGLVHEQIIQTLRPTVYFRGERIQAGEVIVGAPPAQS